MKSFLLLSFIFLTGCFEAAQVPQASITAPRLFTVISGSTLSLNSIDATTNAVTEVDRVYGAYGYMDVHPSGKFIVTADRSGGSGVAYGIIAVDHDMPSLEIKYSETALQTADFFYQAVKFDPGGHSVYALTDNCKIIWSHFNEDLGITESQTHVTVDATPSANCTSLAFEKGSDRLWVVSDSTIYILNTHGGLSAPTLQPSSTTSIGQSFSELVPLASGRVMAVDYGGDSPTFYYDSGIDVVLCDRILSGATHGQSSGYYSSAHSTLDLAYLPSRSSNEFIVANDNGADIDQTSVV